MDLNDIEGAIAAGSRLHGMWDKYKVPYLNGDVEGNRELLEAADIFDKGNGTEISYIETATIRGNFVWELLKKLNDIEESDAKALATPENIQDLMKVWTQQ